MRNVVFRQLLFALLFNSACLQLACAEPQSDLGNVAGSSDHAVKSVPGGVNVPEAGWSSRQFVKWLPEMAMAVFIICYVINIWVGRARNTDVAMAFAKAYCQPEGSLLERNFSQVGPQINGAPDMIMRESMNKFNIYATGRRFCKNFQATLDLKHRQDLLYLASYVISPRPDRIDIDIAMNEANMQPLVLMIGTPRLAKELSKSLPDVKSFARPIDVSQQLLPGFPSKSLHVWTESKSTFYALMTDKVMDLLFGRAAFVETSKYFRYLHFSSENPEGFSKHSLKLSFNLPPEDQMQDMTQVLTATLHFIDVSYWYPCMNLSCHIMSCHVMSCHVMSCHVMSCHVMSCHVMSPAEAYKLLLLLSCHVMSCHVMSCHVMSCHVMSCHVMSCLF